MKEISGGVTAAKGFLASSAEAGIKYKDRTDMALVVSEEPSIAAGVFTTNVVKASPVIWDQNVISSGEKVKAVVLNSGIANACTGKEGDQLNYVMADSIAKELGVQAENILTASTGVIGQQLKEEALVKGAKLLAESLSPEVSAGTLAAKAIMTTDTISKECAVQVDIGGKIVTVGGMSKGSGMIHPNMATMLSVITTDAVIEKALLQEVLSEDVKESFNMISVDRDTSTNDTCVVLANGMAENPVIEKGTEEWEQFAKALSYVTKTLAKKMASDGEGATKLVEVCVTHAKSKEEAVLLSKSVITSPLVKTAVFGSDANWGRILCALGYAGVEFDPDLVSLTIAAKGTELVIVKDGVATDYSEEEATGLLSEEMVRIICDMKVGDASATAWGCDLTYDYVKINGDYRS